MILFLLYDRPIKSRKYDGTSNPNESKYSGLSFWGKKKHTQCDPAEFEGDMLTIYADGVCSLGSIGRVSAAYVLTKVPLVI